MAVGLDVPARVVGMQVENVGTAFRSGPGSRGERARGNPLEQFTPGGHVGHQFDTTAADQSKRFNESAFSTA